MEQAASTRRRFVFGACLGRGGFGEVYQARMVSPGGLESVVAVKALRAELAGGADAVRRLRDEGRLLARLNHPTILKAYDLVLLEGRIALIAELVDGADLADLFRARMPVRPLLQVIGAVASALHAAWSTPGATGAPMHLVHRDIKSTNIRIGRHGDIKLLDFGIAHFQALDREAKTASDVVVGSLPYMAPERFLDRAVLAASDVFSLGCVLFEGLVGEPFHRDANLWSVSSVSVDDESFEEHLAERLALLPPEVPESVAGLVHGMLAWSPAARPDASEVASACEHLADEVGGPPLRRWIREASWPAASEEEAPWVGRTLTEGTLEAEAPPPPPPASPPLSTPRVQRAPVETQEPAPPPRQGASSTPAPARPSAPPARSSAAPTSPATAAAAPVGAEKATSGGSRWITVLGCGGAGLGIGLLVSGLALVLVAAFFAAS